MVTKGNGQLAKWKYDLLATGGSPGDLVVLSSREFKASNLATAKSLLAGVVTNVRAHESVMPNAIRLTDPDGEEIWRSDRWRASRCSPTCSSQKLPSKSCGARELRRRWR